MKSYKSNPSISSITDNGHSSDLQLFNAIFSQVSVFVPTFLLLFINDVLSVKLLFADMLTTVHFPATGNVSSTYLQCEKYLESFSSVDRNISLN